MTARALWIVGKGRAELREATNPAPGPDEVVIRTLYSGISRGTERLVFHGAVPPGERERMRCPQQEGDFPFPVKYGYAAVGIVTGGAPEWQGKTVFALSPHQERQNVPVSLIAEVPADVPPRRAVLAANMETALNAVWDSGVTAGDRVTVVGAGVVGMLIARLCARMPGVIVTLVDIDAAREAIARAMGCRFARSPAPQGDQDVVFHTSASQAGLATALGAAAFEAAIVEVSWFGDRPVTLPLGGPFHSQRLRLISSQVGNVAARQRPRWDFARRRAAALALLADDALDALITEEIAFADLPGAMHRLLGPDAAGLQTVVRY